MSRPRKRLARIKLTRRAISDLLDIEAYSVEQWGKRQAANYLKEIESALRLVRENPGVLQWGEGLPDDLRLYPAGKHLLICDVRKESDARKDSIVVLTVAHASVGIPQRLAELVPQLSAEVALLHKRLSSAGER